MDVERTQSHSMTIVRSRRWYFEGLQHGFTGSASSSSEYETLAHILGVDKILRLKQVHGSAVVDLDALGVEQAAVLAAENPATEADAVFFSLVQPQRFAVTLRTADCLPIIVRGKTHAALVHAGWRGLAEGVIAEALEAFGADAELDAVIGPCACGGCYEVGLEVIQAIGETASFRARGDDKFLLDLARTAARQLQAANGKCRVEIAGVCTIEDREFHSYRRDGETAGRNLTYVVTEGKGE